MQRFFQSFATAFLWHWGKQAVAEQNENLLPRESEIA
jgi:hypothetical protein